MHCYPFLAVALLSCVVKPTLHSPLRPCAHAAPAPPPPPSPLSPLSPPLPPHRWSRDFRLKTNTRRILRVAGRPRPEARAHSHYMCLYMCPYMCLCVSICVHLCVLTYALCASLHVFLTCVVRGCTNVLICVLICDLDRYVSVSVSLHGVSRAVRQGPRPQSAMASQPAQFWFWSFGFRVSGSRFSGQVW